MADDRLYFYAAKVDKVVDGDTFDALVDLGFRMSIALRIRVLGINAPEMHGRSRPDGERAKAFARLKLEGQTVTVRTHKADDFGRWLADVTLPDGSDFGGVMLRELLAVPYMA